MRNRPLCVAPRCTSRGYHWPDCSNHECTGCQPRLAADGLLLCRGHRDRIAADATRAAQLYGDLTLVLAGTGSSDEKTSGSREYGANLNERATEARTTIRAVLSSWCRLVSEERGIHPPKKRVIKLLPLGFIGPAPLVWTVDDRPIAMGRYLALHADWLAAHPAAGECSDELDELVRNAHPIAYPSGARVIEVASCPHKCEGMIKAILRRADSLLPSAIVCDVDEHHTWPADQWLTLGKQLRRAA